jgi:hypothetical protein
VFGYFKHRVRTWRVNADTHVAPLLEAYAFDGDPFDVVRTRAGTPCRALKAAVASRRRMHVYIYQTPKA